MVTVVATAAVPLYPDEVIVPREDPSSANVIVPPSASKVIPPEEFKVTVVPTASNVPSAVIVIFADVPVPSVVVIAKTPFAPTVIVAVSPLEPVMVITLPSMATSSTVSAVAVVVPASSTSVNRS